MTHRREDPGFFEWLKRLQARVEKIERGSARQNSVRIGQVLIEADNDNDRLSIRNVRTGALTKFLPEKREVFGWVGTVTLGDDYISPPAHIFDTMIITEVILSVITPTTTGAIGATLHIFDAGGLELEVPISLPETLVKTAITTRILVHNGDSMYVELTDEGDGSATNMSLTVRFDG